MHVMNQQHLFLAQHLGYGRLLRYTFPAIVMMVVTSVYTVVDGFFVSNFVGKTSFAAVNFVFPVIMILGSVGFMFGTGGGALIAKTLGEGDRGRAGRLFSLVVFAAFLCGVVLAAAALLFLRPYFISPKVRFRSMTRLSPGSSRTLAKPLSSLRGRKMRLFGLLT